MFDKGIRQIYASRFLVKQNQAAYVNGRRAALKRLAVLKETAASQGYPRLEVKPKRSYATLIRRYGETKVEAR